MKKKTKERLDRIEKRLQQLVEDVQEFKGLSHRKENVKNIDAGSTHAPKVTVKAAQKPFTKGQA